MALISKSLAMQDTEVKFFIKSIVCTGPAMVRGCSLPWKGHGLHQAIMLVYAALWGHCDKNGTFEWRPKQLKLDILPFLPFSMDHVLELLEGAGFIKKFEALGKHYGSIPCFLRHQRISGSEATDPAKYPEYQSHAEKEALGKQRGSNGDELVSQEGKGKEGKGSAFALPDWVPPDAWNAFVEMRKRIKSPLTDHAKDLAVSKLSELRAEGHDPRRVIDLAVLNGWKSFYPPKEVNLNRCRYCACDS